MQRKHLVRAVAALLGAAVMAAPASAAGPCQLMVVSRPAGATVHIDGEERGKTPLMLPGLKIGFHDIKVVLDGHVTWAKRMRLRPGGNTADAKLAKKGAPAPAGPKERDKDGAAPPKAGGAPPDPAAKAAKTGKDEKDEKDEIPKTRKVPCPCCEGNGVVDEIGCDTCAADGYVGTTACGMCRSTGRREFKCPFCLGNGGAVAGGKAADCRGCKGKGAPLCAACKGEGEIDRLNPEAVKYETTVCISCAGEGWERNLKCNRCAGKGTIKVRSGDANFVYALEISCPLCKGQGTGPPRCNRCSGRGHRGSGKKLFACMTCYGTGHLFMSCRMCRGNGWHRMR
ncbi:MAG: PEGA domain-containing protein [Planctomycetota bacterium]|jgi:DnaJ-class molecular chaperone